MVPFHIFLILSKIQGGSFFMRRVGLRELEEGGKKEPRLGQKVRRRSSWLHVQEVSIIFLGTQSKPLHQVSGVTPLLSRVKRQGSMFFVKWNQWLWNVTTIFLIDNAAATAYLEKKSINYFNELSTFEAVICLLSFCSSESTNILISN